MTNPIESGTEDIFTRPPGYRSYLLRFWEERGEQLSTTVWRFSLEDPLTAQRHNFADLAALTVWLQSETVPSAG